MLVCFLFRAVAISDSDPHYGRLSESESAWMMRIQEGKKQK